MAGHASQRDENQHALQRSHHGPSVAGLASTPARLSSRMPHHDPAGLAQVGCADQRSGNTKEQRCEQSRSVRRRFITATRPGASAAGSSAPPWPWGASGRRFIARLGRAPGSAQAPPPRPPELCAMSAVDLAARLARKQVSAREVMTAHLAQIERVNPKVNAIVTLVADRAMADAAKADEAIARGGPVGRAARPADRAQGPRRHRRHPHHARFAVLQGPRADARRADRDADSRRRRHHRRQDQHAGVRRRVADVQRRSSAPRAIRTT